MKDASEEKLPVSDFYNVIDHVTIFRSEKWWKAVVLYESSGRRSVGLYLWNNRDGVWKRKHKFTIANSEEWSKVKNSVDQLVSGLGQS